MKRIIASALAPYRDRDILCFFALGYSSGVPFLLMLGTLSFRLAENGVTTQAIGWLTWITLPYAVKFLWGPYLETHGGRILKTRKRRCALSQAVMIASLICLGRHDGLELMPLILWGTVASFAAATQDLLTDSIRLDLTREKAHGPASAAQAAGFRLGMFAAGAGTLYIAHGSGWSIAYTLTALSCTAGTLALYFLPPLPAGLEPLTRRRVHIVTVLKSLRHHPRLVSVLLFAAGYKCADSIFNAMAAPFLYELGFDKIAFANFTKTYGVALMLSGSFIAEPAVRYLGLRMMLILTLLMQAFSGLLFIAQYHAGKDPLMLALTMGVECLTSGMAGTVFIISLSEIAGGKSYAGTVFSTLYALSSAGRLAVSGLAGSAAVMFGWPAVFAAASALALLNLYAARQAVAES